MSWTPTTGKKITEPNAPWTPQSGRAISQPDFSDEQLLDRLHGTIPGQTPTSSLTYAIPGQGPQNIAGQQQRSQRIFAEQRAAFDQLQRRGYDPEQIGTALTARQIMSRQPMEVGRTVGAIAGSLGLPAALNLIPGFAALPEEAITVPLAARLMQGGAAVAGAGVGGAAGKAAEIGLTEKRSPQVKELLRAAAIEAGFEAGARGVIKGTKTLASPFIKKIAPEAAETIDDYARVGGYFSPGQQDRRLSLRVAESISRGSFGGKELFDQFGEMQEHRLAQLAQSLVDDLAEGAGRLGDAELGDMLFAAVRRPGGRYWTMVDEAVDPLYRQVEKRAGRAMVNVRPMKKFAADTLRRDAAAKGNMLSDAGRSRLKRILALDDDTPFNALRDVRSALLKEERKMALELSQDTGVVRKLSGLANDAIYDTKSIRGMDARSKRMLHKANRLYRAASDEWERTFPKRTLAQLEKNPQRATRLAFPNRNEKHIRSVRQLLTRGQGGQVDTEGKLLWDRLRQSWLADVVGASSSEGVLNPRTFERHLKNMGDKALQEMFSPDELRRIRNIGKIAKTIRPKGSGGAALFSKSLQIGQLEQMAGLALSGAGFQGRSGIAIAAGGGLLLSPIAYARLATSEAGSRLLKMGLTVPRGSKQIAITGARMAQLLAAMDKQEQSALKRGRAREMALQHLMTESQAIRRPNRSVGGHHF